MVSERRRRRAARRLRNGDGRALPPFRVWQLLTRSLFHVRLQEPGEGTALWSVDTRHGGNTNGEIWVDFYRDRRQVARSKPPAVMPVTGGVIEVAVSHYGLKRCHLVRDDGREQPLQPDPASAAGARARLAERFPGASRALGVVSVVILLIALVLGIPQLAEQITAIPPIGDRVGIFTSPLQLPWWVNVSLIVAAIVASTERALRLRYHRLLDGGMLDGSE